MSRKEREEYLRPVAAVTGVGDIGRLIRFRVNGCWQWKGSRSNCLVREPVLFYPDPDVEGHTVTIRVRQHLYEEYLKESGDWFPGVYAFTVTCRNPGLCVNPAHMEVSWVYPSLNDYLDWERK